MPEDRVDISGRTVEEQILRYLELHPQATDTLAGIAQWWRAQAKTPVDPDALTAVLEALAKEGRLQVIRSGATRLYRLVDVREVRCDGSDVER